MRQRATELDDAGDAPAITLEQHVGTEAIAARLEPLLCDQEWDTARARDAHRARGAPRPQLRCSRRRGGNRPTARLAQAGSAERVLIAAQSPRLVRSVPYRMRWARGTLVASPEDRLEGCVELSQVVCLRLCLFS